MSGSPIIQDGKIIGVLTHVFVNDPTGAFSKWLGRSKKNEPPGEFFSGRFRLEFPLLRLRNEEIRSICEVRIALDTLAARLCVDSLSDEQIDILYEKVCEMKDAQKMSEAVQAAFEFQHEFALMSNNTLIPLIIQSFKSPIFAMWERYCALYGLEALYENNYKMWTYIANRDTEGVIKWVESSMKNCIEGNQQIYYE